MRILLASVAALTVAANAGAQQRAAPATPPPVGSPGVARSMPVPPRQPGVRPHPAPVAVASSPSAARHPARGSRWGERIDGRWWGGARAPGGWAAYRRPFNGWTLPGYWVAPAWQVGDWSAYGLPTPPGGYGWSRYYDDAVLIDAHGQVYDTIGGVDWDRPGRAVPDYAYDQGGSAYGASYDYSPRRDDGVGGALAGAAIGGVAGNLVAGRGNRLGGTLIGAGVGAAAGYAIDRAEDRERRGPPPPPPPPLDYADYGYGPDYPSSGFGDTAPRVVRTPDGTTITTVTSGGGPGYYAAGYYFPAGTTTTVTVQTAPVVTTTETVCDCGTPRRSWRRAASRPPSKKLLRR